MTYNAFSASEIRDAASAALECLAWSTPTESAYMEELPADAPEFLDGTDADFSDAARDTMYGMLDGFLSDERVVRLFALLSLYGVDFTPEQIGHDFILTANGHGAGFWDRDYRTRPHAALEALSAIVRPYGEISAYLSDGDTIDIQ